jgi:type II secretory pathway pseudopilin PulG
MTGTGAVRADRPGMSLVELLYSMTLFSLVLVAAVAALQKQSEVFGRGNDQLSVVQNYRYTLSALEQDLRQAGAGVLANQPTMIYAGASVVAFNADYASRTPGDISAVYYDPDAPVEAVTALGANRRITVPTTAFGYPDTTYTVGGVNSPAETIVFFFQADEETERADDYRLYRRVNDLEPELVARGLVALEGRPFFQYRELVTSDTAPDAIVPVSPGVLPLAHAAPVHLSIEDTAAVGRIDALRAVEVNVGAWNGRTGDAAQVVPVRRLIWLRNVRERAVEICGSPPLPVAAPGAAAGTNASGEPVVQLTWQPSPDEGGGEQDVVRYLLWRRPAGSGAWGDPYLSIPAGNTSYVYEDASVAEGQIYEYAVSAQDCTPAISDQSAGVTVAVPTS